MSEIIVAVITGCFGLIGSVIVAAISSSSTKEAVTKKLEVSQAVTETKLEELTREVRKHNNFAERVPVIEEQIKVANHRIEDLEKGA
ncbi:MAG: hypothetical protein K6G34_11150 [Lachnospiraceae bacterium]|nr:hypothetical protein [Lachnospiraceae bacterium]